MMATPVPTIRRAQQAIVALVILAMTFTSSANTVTYTGATPLNFGNSSPTFIWPVPLAVGEGVTIDIDTQSLTGPAGTSVYIPALNTGNQTLNLNSGFNISGGGLGVYMNSWTGNITGNINGNIDAAGNVFTLDTRWAGDGGDIKVSGTGSLGGTSVGAGMWLLADTGTITVDGLSSIKGGTWGILINTNGTWSGNPGGATNIGMTTPLGTVTSAGGYGIQVAQAGNAFGDGAINMCLTDVIAPNGYGVVTTAWTAPTNIAVNSVDSGLTGIWSTSTHGAITVKGKTAAATVKGGTWGIAAWASGSGDVTVKDFASVEGTSAAGIWTAGTTGMTSVNNIGSIKANTYGIYSISTTGGVTIDNVGAITAGLDGINAASTSGHINIGQTTPITSIDAGTNGIIATSATGDVKTTFTGLIKAGASGILSTSGTGDTLVDGKGTGTIDAGAFGVRSTTTGKIDVVNIADIKSDSTGIWTTGTTGATNIDNIAKVDAGLDGIYATSTTGLIDIGRTVPIGPVTAANLGIYAVAAAAPIYICATDVTAANIAITGSTTGANPVEIHAGGIVKSTASDGIWGVSGSGKVTVEGRLCTGSVDAYNDGIFASTTGDIDILNWKSIDAQTGNGIWTVNTVGNTKINKTGNIDAGLSGIISTASTGNIDIDKVGTVNAGAYGIIAATAGGNIDIGQTDGVGTITSVSTGIDAVVAGAGHINVTAGDITSTAGFGIHTAALTGNTVIKDGGTITSPLTGIYGTSTTGSITADGLGTGIVNGGDEGITLDPGAGPTADANVLNFAKITGNDAGIWTPADGGTVNIQGNKSIEGKGSWGILASNTTGDINIGTTAANGPILGKTHGIERLSMAVP
jgi:hypothetical protein